MLSLPVLQAPPKPLYGEPCNGCGICCQHELCPLAKDLLGQHQKGPCPKLTWQDGRFQCGFVLEETNPLLKGFYLEAIGSIGMCDSVINKADRKAALLYARKCLTSKDKSEQYYGLQLTRMLLGMKY